MKNHIPPKEVLSMLSSNVKYIGLDVHKEAIAIAVLNGTGKLVMESIVEIKSSTLLDFLHGLRGNSKKPWAESEQRSFIRWTTGSA